MNTKQIEIENVGSVYSGKVGCCMCGCAGIYWVASKYRHEETKHRGYGFDDGQISDRNVARIVNIINKNISIADDFGSGISVDIGNRIYAACFISRYKN